MSFLPDDITDTLEQRYVPITRDTLPDVFWDDPVGILNELSQEYHDMVVRADTQLGNLYHDWAVQVELDPDNAVSVTDVTVAQRGKWVEFRGLVVRVRDPVPRAVSVAWVCAKCDNIIYLAPTQGKPDMCSCKSRAFKAAPDLSTLIDSQDILLGEDYEEVKGLRVPESLACKLDGPLIRRLNPGDRCVVGGIMNIEKTKTGLMYELQANNVKPYRPVKEVPDIRGDPPDALVKSFASRVLGNHTIKKAIILLLAGGTPWWMTGEPISTFYRWAIQALQSPPC